MYGPINMELSLEFLNTQYILIYITIITVIGYYLNFRWKRRRLYYLTNKIPGPKGLPFFGNAFDLEINRKDKLLKQIEQWRFEFSLPYKIWVGPEPLITIARPQDLAIVLNSPYALNRGRRFVRTGRKMIGDGILLSDMPKWKPRRKMIASTFSPKILESFVPSFIKQSNILIQKIENEVGKGYFNVWNYFGKMALDSICVTAMGVELNAQTQDSKYVKAASMILDLFGIRLVKAWTFSDFLFYNSHYGKIFKKYHKDMHDFITEIIIDRKKKIDKETSYNIKDVGYGKNPFGKAFLDYFLELTRHDNTITMEDIKNEVDTIMLTGFETTANTLSFSMITMAMNQHVQQKLYDEVVAVMGDREIRYEDIPQLTYLEMFIKETLRLYPIVMVFFRHLEKEIEIDEYTLPGESTLVISPFLLHRDPYIWPNPLNFDPNRFLPEECAKRHPYSFIPFAGGPRNCVGFRYAMISLKIYLAKFIKHYKVFTNLTEDTIVFDFDSTLKIKNGYTIRLEKR